MAPHSSTLAWKIPWTVSCHLKTVRASFLIWIPFISFSSLIAIARISRKILNNSGESEHPCLVPDLRGNGLFFTTENNVCCRLVIYGLYYVEVGSFYAHFLKSFNHKWVLNFCQRLFLHLLR